MNLLKKVGESLLVFSFVTQIFAADSTCFLRIDACNLDNLHGKTVEVPTEITEISKDVKSCLPEVGFQGSFQDTASIFFIIDESGSMAQNDSGGTRYEVTKQFLDQMYSTYPYVRVGVAVFSDRLQWHINDDPLLFSKIGDYQYSDAYIPLMPLDSTLGNGKSALENIKTWLETYTDLYGIIRLATKTSQTKERSGGSSQGTDISLGFEAAKDAFSKTPTDPRRQFIVFISDGEARDVNTERLDSMYNFTQGEDVPTTYTFYLCQNCSDAPTSLQNMTENIQTNGYSATNEKSSVTAITDPDNDLLGLMQSLVVEEPISATVSASSGTLSGQSSIAATDTNFVFPQAIALNSSGVEISVSLTFDYTYPQAGAPPDGDTTLTATFTVRQSSSISLQDFDPIDGLLYQCIKVSPVQPAYFDTDGDGYIDQIKVYLDEDIASAELDSLAKRITNEDLPSHRKLTVDGIRSMYNGFIIDVTQDKSVAINTAVDPNLDKLHIDEYIIKPGYDNFVPGGTYNIADSLPPVLISATYLPLSLEDQGNLLEIQFSEPIPEVTDVEPFRLLQDGNIYYTMIVENVLEVNGANHKFKISEVRPELGNAEIFAKSGDSIWIYEGRVSDGNVTQNNSKNHPVELIVQYPIYRYELGAIQINPALPEDERKFPGFGTLEEGAMVIVRSLMPTGDSTSVRFITEVNVNMYDAIGNHMGYGEYFPNDPGTSDNQNVEIKQSGSDFFFWWNGRNKNARAVESGTYLAIVTVKRNENEAETKEQRKIKVALRR